jgi:transposase
MFLKRCFRKKNGKRHVYWQLVESYRTPQGSRHRVVGYLGELSKSARRGWARLATVLDGKAATKAEQLSLLDQSDPDPTLPDTITVDLNGVRVQRTRDFGGVYLALTLWRMLELDDLLDQRIAKGDEAVPWSLMAAVLAIARFCEPDSELHVEDTWYPRTALGEMLGISENLVNDTRLYRTLDVILALKSEIEGHLKSRIGELFKPDFDLLLYDVTSTYFEGQAEENPQAKRGYSRDHRPDTKQVCVALVVTREGFPLGYEVFSGNRADVTTVKEIVEAMEAKYGQAGRVWVMDRGMVSQENLEFLRTRNARYLVGTPKSMLRQFEKHLLDKDWEEVRDGVEVRLVSSADAQETFVLCRSEDRREKEKAIHARFLARIEDGLSKLEKTLAGAARKRDKVTIGKQIGRLLGRNSRGAGAFQIEVVDAPEHRSGLKLVWSRVNEWEDWATLSEGCYLLRTNITDQTPQQLWQTYMQLTEVEAAFRTHKSDLQIRPIWHQLEHRVQAHILFSFLAYAMWKTLQTWMDRSGLGRGTRTVIEEVARIKACDVILPTSTGREVRVCCITEPDAAQRSLIDRLGLAIPQRLGRPSWVAVPQQLDSACSIDFSPKSPQHGL